MLRGQGQKSQVYTVNSARLNEEVKRTAPEIIDPGSP